MPHVVQSGMGYLLAILAAMLWGFAYALDHKIVHALPVTLIIALGAGINLGVMIPVIAYQGNWGEVAAMTRTTMVQLVLSTAALIAAGFCTLESIRLIGAARASSMEIAYPLFTVVFLFLLFKEVSSWWTLVGAALIFAGSVIIVLKS